MCMYNPKKKKRKGIKRVNEDPALSSPSPCHVSPTQASPVHPSMRPSNVVIRCFPRSIPTLSSNLFFLKPNPHAIFTLSSYHPIIHPSATIYQISSSLLTISTVGVFGSNLFILFLSALVTKDGVIGTTGEKGW